MDAPLVLEMIASAAAGVTPGARSLLDIGCGAGNYTLKVLERFPALEEITLIDLSRPMLDRAQQRISAVAKGKINLLQTDLREADLGENRFDLIVAAAVLHHLRTDEQWRSVFARLHRALSPGGSIWISDMVEHTFPPVQAQMKNRWGEYLVKLKNEDYKRTVYDYIEKEDTPRSLMFQIDLLRSVGFSEVEILHKNAVFTAFGARK
jgi:tRNA (cmo5U34)-methyltransferase